MFAFIYKYIDKKKWSSTAILWLVENLYFQEYNLEVVQSTHKNKEWMFYIQLIFIWIFKEISLVGSCIFEIFVAENYWDWEMDEEHLNGE